VLSTLYGPARVDSTVVAWALLLLVPVVLLLMGQEGRARAADALTRRDP
jgi:hypothetical protein